MALTKLLSPRTVVFLAIFLCILVDLGYSEDVSYTVEGASLEPVIAIESHNVQKRAIVTNDTNSDAGMMTDVPTNNPVPNSTNAPTTEAPAPPTTAAPAVTTNAPSGGGISSESPTPLTTTIVDDHKYYHSQILPPEYVDDHWVEQKDAVKHKTLSDNYRVAVSVQMSFNFRFYGHEINSVTIATGGFLYMSPFLHKWLTATQYIAPLMGNFDTTLGNTSEILYKDYNDMFIVEWSDIYLQDQNHTHPFVFQTQLYQNGTIKFIYKKLPLAISEINRASHPVKIGLSDAYYIDSSVNGTARKNGTEQKYSDYSEGKNRRTIYEYHRVEVDTSLVREGTVVILHPKKTCNLLMDCETCVTDELGFDCKWCGEVQRCSDGVDWNRQTWRDKGCTTKGNDNVTLCNVAANTTQVPAVVTTAMPTTTLPPSVPPVVTTTSAPSVPPTTSEQMVTTSVGITIVTSPPKVNGIVCDKTRVIESLLLGVNFTEKMSMCLSLPKENKRYFAYPTYFSLGIVIAVIVILLILIGSIGGWVFYAYTHPQSSSGMWLMEHRPSQMKQKMAKMKFWKKTTSSGEKYEIRSEAEA
ncbi:plexin domain-containing protein 2-like [Ylistrum balloti]|uniref:plexin domain-containing protein 2-like n=1 Tax=Ylistrum balloti TaxID=509963 RepID=UPI002905EBB4|nr:plexin domain-containing protein 2-like [Ylistrum balloti]